jgi:hypothetical protein
MKILSKQFFDKIYTIARSPAYKLSKRLILIISLMAFCNELFAASNDDPLAGTMGGLVATMSSGGTGRMATFIVQGIVGAATYVRTNNLLLMFGGPLAIEVFLRLVMKLAGA